MVDGRPDLRSSSNAACCRCASEERRQKLDEGLCPDVLSVLDKEAVRCVGEWARDKIYFLVKYFGIFSLGMKNKFAGKLTYVEICCGPGRCILRETGDEIDGTALAIVNHAHLPLLAAAVFLDHNPQAADILNRRIQRLGQQGRAAARVADYTDASQVLEAIGSLPGDGLSLVFIDPTDCSVPFSTIRAIVTALGRVDLIVTVPIGTDFNRNAARAVLEPAKFAALRDKYASFLGADRFFVDSRVITAAERGNHARLCTLFRDYYHDALGAIGYKHFDHQPVRQYYDVMYATQHKLGLKFWREAQRYGPNNQKSLDL